MGTYTFTKNLKGVSIVLLLLLIVGIIPFTKLQADPIGYNFNDTTLEDLLETEFTETGPNTFAYSASGGLNSSGAIDVQNKEAIWTTQNPYDSTEEDGNIVIGAYFYNFSNSGFGSIGITPTAVNPPLAEHYLVVPEDGIALYFHGGGGGIMNDGVDFDSFSWDEGDIDNGWYYFELSLTPTGADAYNASITILESNINGTFNLLHTINTSTNIVNSSLRSAEDVYGFFSTSQSRFSRVDNFGVGGVSLEYEIVPSESPFDGGTGIDVDPYEISDCEQLQAIGSSEEYLSAYYEFTSSEIDCSDTENWNLGDGFIPIGDWDVPFTGTINGELEEGGSVVITDLYINYPSEGDNAVGLFGHVGYDETSGNIYNIELYNATIINNSDSCTGTIAGELMGDLYTVFATGTVEGQSCTGGLVGYQEYSTFDDVGFEGTIISNRFAGGIVGDSYMSNIVHSYFEGTINTYDEQLDMNSIGGIAGTAYDLYIGDSTATGSINLNSLDTENTFMEIDIDNVGGLVGFYEEFSEIVDSTANVNIDIKSGTSYLFVDNIGGLAGTFCEDEGECLIERSTALGSINIGVLNNGIYSEALNMSNIGGFIGSVDVLTDGLIAESYTETDINIDLSSLSSETDSDIDDLGGFIGELDYQAEDGLIRDTYTRSNITINAPTAELDNIGGFIGRSDTFYPVEIRNSYTASNIVLIGKNEPETTDIGGFIGEVNADSEDYNETTLQNVFRAGALTINSPFPADRVGGFAGEVGGNDDSKFFNNYIYNTGSVTTCYPEDTLMTEGCVEVDNDKPFKSPAKQPLTEWDFETIWAAYSGVNDGYPVFRWALIDFDSDGIPDEIEESAPNDGDANGDEIIDSDQSNVASFINIETGEYVVLEANESCTIQSVFISLEEDNGIEDMGYNYPVGLVNFIIECEPGFTADLKIYEYGLDTSKEYTLRKYVNDGYYSIDHDIEVLQIGGQEVVVTSYQVTDGGEFDLDEEVNGIIVDPVGFGLLTVGVPNTGLGGMAN